MIILYDNKVASSTISSFSENPNFRWSSAVNDTVLARTGRSVGDAGEWIQFTFSSAVSATHFMILNHNFEAGATVRLQANSVDAWGAPPLNRLQTISDVIYDSFTSASYQYWRVYMDHATSVAGYFSLSKIFIGTSYQPVDPNAGIEMPLVVESNFSKSRGGQIYGQSATQLQTYRISLSGLTQAQVDSYKTFQNTVNNNTPFIFVPFESSTSTISPIYANANSHGSILLTEDFGIHYGISGIEYQECK